MIVLARLMARTPFGIGLAVGILLSVCFAPLAESRAATNPPCDGQMAVPPEVQTWINLQCSVRQGTFGDAADPGTCYKFDKAISTAGLYNGTTHLAEAVSFDAVYVIPLNLKQDAPALDAQGVVASVVVGRLGGPAGKIAITGLVILPSGSTPNTGHFLLVGSVLTNAELDTYAVAARIQAGVRVVDSTTGQSRPLDEVSSANSLWGFPSDPSTLYCGCEAGFGGGVDMECVRLAYERHNEREKTARENNSLCNVIAGSAALACVALCTAAWLIPIIGGGAAVICYLGCLAAEAVALAGCYGSLQIALNSSKRQLLIDLRACGVEIYEF